MSFLEAQEDHVSKTLERVPIVAPTDLTKRRHYNELGVELRQLLSRQSELSEAGEARAVGCIQEALEALETARQFLVGPR